MNYHVFRNEEDVETIAKLQSWVNSLERSVDRLKGELGKEREAHRQEVDELKWRLDAVTVAVTSPSTGHSGLINQ